LPRNAWARPSSRNFTISRRANEANCTIPNARLSGAIAWKEKNDGKKEQSDRTYTSQGAWRKNRPRKRSISRRAKRGKIPQLGLSSESGAYKEKQEGRGKRVDTGVRSSKIQLTASIFETTDYVRCQENDDRRGKRNGGGMNEEKN